MTKQRLPRRVFEKPVYKELIKRRVPATPAPVPPVEPPMAESNNGSTTDNPYEPMWARWARSVDWRDALYKRAAHKALDIPDEMGDINAPKTMVSHNGISPWAIVALAAIGLYGANLFRQPPPQAPPAQQPAAVVDTDTDTLTEMFLPK